MVRRIRSISLICVVICICVVAPAENDVKSLENFLKSADLNLVNPATKDFVPGGLVVSDGKRASYNPLPTGTSFTPSDPTQQAFYQAAVGKNFSLAALLSGLGSVLHAGLSVNHSNTTTINQIDATAQSVDGQSVVENPAVAKRIKTWIQPNEKKPKYQVFVVIKTFSSKTISVSDTSNLGIAAAFGTDVPTCSDASGNSEKTTKPAAKAGVGDDGKTGTGATAVKNGGAAAPIAKPTASLKFCSNSNSKVSLNATDPLVFAVVLRPVTFDAQGQNLVMGPVSVVVKPSEVGGLAEPEPIAIKKAITKPIFKSVE